MAQQAYLHTNTDTSLEVDFPERERRVLDLPRASHQRWGSAEKPLIKGVMPPEIFPESPPVVEVCEFCRVPLTESSREHYYGSGLTLRQEEADMEWDSPVLQSGLPILG